MTREEYIKFRNGDSIDITRLAAEAQSYMKSKGVIMTLQETLICIKVFGFEGIVEVLDKEFCVQSLHDKSGEEIKVY